MSGRREPERSGRREKGQSGQRRRDVVYGRNPVTEARRGRRKVRRVWTADDTDAAELTRIAGSPDHQGVVAEVDPYPYADPSALLRSPQALVVALDQVQDPHNLGAICRSAEAAVEGAQVLTTCTADKQYATILTDNMVGAGIHINAIGGDCPGKTELHPDILRRAEIFVEYPPQTRVEGEIQQLAPDHPVTELWEVLAGRAEGRCDARQITLFDSVGFAIEDFSALRYVLDRVRAGAAHLPLDMLADPDDPRDLFGMLRRAEAAGPASAVSGRDAL